MENIAVAKLSHVRISPRKVKIVIDLIRNKPVGTALAILRNTPKAASSIVEKLLLSAIANAENNHNMDVESLYVAEIYANQGPTMKRIRPRAQGRAYRIFKRTSHITIVLKEKDAVAAATEKEEKAKKSKKAATKKDAANKAADSKASETKKEAKTEAKVKTKAETKKEEKTDTKEETKAKKSAARKKAEPEATATEAVQE